MTTTLSSKGQVVLPKAARRKLGLVRGTKFNCRVREGEIVLVPEARPATKVRTSRNAISGFPVLTPPQNTPPLTSERVRELLTDFPGNISSM
jgi:AbrB family looped-hinge helix DNA binding protein